MLSRSNRRLTLVARQINIHRTNSGNILPLRKGLCWLIDPLTLADSTKEINTSKRLAALRAQMAKHEVAVYVIPLADQHQLEYTAPIDKKRSFISGFSGSAGTAVVTRDILLLNDEPEGLAALQTDGRYFNQAANELDFNWRLLRQGAKGEPLWQQWAADQAVQLAQDSGKVAFIGIDPRLLSFPQYKSFAKTIEESVTKACGKNPVCVEIKAVLPNLVDEIWTDFETLPPALTDPISELSQEYAGTDVATKLAQVSEKVFSDSVCGFVVSALDEIAWLLNLRGSDIEFNPVFFAFMVLTKDAAHTLYVDQAKLSQKALEHLSQNNVSVKPYQEFYAGLEAFSKECSVYSNKIALTECVNWEVIRTIKCDYTQIKSPVAALKAIKNTTEIEGTKKAQIKDGRALVKFFSWLEQQLVVKDELIDEVVADDKLTEFRKMEEEFVGLSFDTISSTGANAAIIHYKPSKATCATINPNKIYLCDSGLQFLSGTTDITRTIHFGSPSTEERRNYTLVLKGMIALAEAQFPEGTPGCLIDVLARQFLWQEGLDYGHGTGHGIGAYLNVHEGPIGISNRVSPRLTPLEPGNYLLNEPGFYKDGDYGIRIENDMFVVDTGRNYNGKSFYKFETVSLVPYCRSLIDVSLLLLREIEWLNSYHKKVWDTLSPSFGEKDLTYKWLKRETAPFRK